MEAVFYNLDVRTLIYFTRELPGLSPDLELAGFQVYEALALSEVFFLVEQHPSAHIVIDANVEDTAAKEVAQHHPTLRLNPSTTATDVLWGLSSLSPDATVQ